MSRGSLTAPAHRRQGCAIGVSRAHSPDTVRCHADEIAERPAYGSTGVRLEVALIVVFAHLARRTQHIAHHLGVIACIDTGTNGVVFISGDVHWGELSKRSADGGYPVYDVTSSGITQTWSTPDENSNRLGEPESKNNFGMIEIDWLPADPTIRLAVTNVDGLVTIEHTVALSELQVP